MKIEIIRWIKLKRFEICCVFILLVVLGGSWVGNTAKINDLLSTISKQKQELIDIKANIQILESKVIELKSANRIIPIAENKLNLQISTSLPIVVEDSISNND